MATSTATKPEHLETAGTPRRFAAARWVLRILATLQALLVIGQPIWIGMYLDGSYAMRDLHSAGAAFSTFAAFFLIPVSIWYVIAGGRAWVLWPGIGFLFLLEAQSIVGYVPQLAVHVPLGVASVMAAVAFAIWAWTPASGRFRQRRRRARGRRARRLEQERKRLSRDAEELVGRGSER